MAKGLKTGGRKKGTPNKVTATAKSAISLAAEKLGGGERLYEWVMEDPDNERAFWVNIYPKMLPHTHEGAGANGEHLAKLTVEYVSRGKD